MKQNNGKIEYTTNENEASMFYTDDKGNIPVEGAVVGNYTYYEDPNTLPYGYDITSKSHSHPSFCASVSSSKSRKSRQ